MQLSKQDPFSVVSDQVASRVNILVSRWKKIFLSEISKGFY